MRAAAEERVERRAICLRHAAAHYAAPLIRLRCFAMLRCYGAFWRALISRLICCCRSAMLPATLRAILPLSGYAMNSRID